MSIHGEHRYSFDNWIEWQRTRSLPTRTNTTNGGRHGNRGTPAQIHGSAVDGTSDAVAAGTASQQPSTTIRACPPYYAFSSSPLWLSAVNISAVNMQFSGFTFTDYVSHPGPPIPTTDIHVGEITAYRLWIVDQSMRGAGQPRLKSWGVDRTWEPGVPMTVTDLACQPNDYGLEGVWGFKDATDAMKKLDEHTSDGLGIMGTIKIWGRVVEHRLGYRASHAKIVSLAPGPPISEKLLHELRKIYGV